MISQRRDTVAGRLHAAPGSVQAARMAGPPARGAGAGMQVESHTLRTAEPRLKRVARGLVPFPAWPRLITSAAFDCVPVVASLWWRARLAAATV